MSKTKLISSKPVRDHLIVIAILAIGLIWRIAIATSSASPTETDFAAIPVSSPVEPESLTDAR